MPEWMAQVLEFFETPLWRILRGVLLVAALLAITPFVARALDRLIRRVFRRLGERGRLSLTQGRAATVGTLLGSVCRYVVWVLGVWGALAVLGLSQEAGMIVATAGISMSLVLGFGAQKLIQDFFAGFIFLADHPFAVGDVVTIGGITGTVESLKLRTTVVRSFTGEVHVLPNGGIGAITNLSQGGHSLAICEVYVPAAHALDSFCPLLKKAALQAVQGEEDVLEPPQVLGITSITDRDRLCVRTICRTKPMKHYALERKLRAFQHSALLEAGLLAGGDANP